MSYTALEKMREFNLNRFGKDVGPFQPEKHFDEPSKDSKDKGFDLKSAALRFLHNRCEDLKFDAEIEKEETESGKYLGKSIKENQIPYNMQMDLNRLCLERELEHFIDSGVAEDAYNIYYCYMEIFFGHYSRSKKMVELLSEFESNGSSLLMKHRDHYSHSVYVFALGLALYETNSLYRAAFKKFYKFDTDDNNAEQDHKAANFYLEFWGLSSLFHDIGHPFEPPFEQVLSYFEVDRQERGKGSVYIAYKDVDKLINFPEEVKARLKELFDDSDFSNANELFAFDIYQKLGEQYHFSEDYMGKVLSDKPMRPDEFGYFMDHAWFSATRLFQELVKPEIKTEKDENGKEKVISVDWSGLKEIRKEHIDALTAIILHNSLYKFKIAYYKDAKEKKEKKLPNALKMEWHPLAYMLMLCDELQCWDRTAYGRNSRSELHPMAARFSFVNNSIKATYIYDADEIDKIDEYKDKYKKYLEDLIKYTANHKKDEKEPEAPKLKAYGSMYETKQSFRTDIEKIVEINVPDGIAFSVAVKTATVDRSSKHTYLSDSNFLHLYDFAVSLHSRHYLDKEENADTGEMEKEFEIMSLEYKLSNINRAKNFGKYLNAIDCFYTDRPVDFNIVHSFTPEQAAIFAPMEHERWIKEHRRMGWHCGNYYLSNEALAIAGGQKKSGELREQLRMHKLAMDGELTTESILKHYNELSERDKGKDWKPFNSMLKLIKKYDGVRIYKLK